MKKSLLILASIFIFLLPVITLAAELDEILGKIRSAVWDVFAIAVVVCFVIAGIMFLISQGDPAKMQTAKKALIMAVIGTAVGILAYSALGIMKAIIGEGGGGSVTI